MTGPRILIMDIENSSHLVDRWSLYDTSPTGLAQLRRAGQVISFAAGWEDSDRILFRSDFHDGHEAMVRAAQAVLDEADILVTYNGKKHDVRHLNREIILAGLPEPSPYKHVDLYPVVRSRFAFASYKLTYVAQQLGVGSKVQHDGHDLWVRCMDGDPKAWALMRRYNKQDVVLTKGVLAKVRPWIRSFPNMGLWAEDGDVVCPVCGGGELEKRGFALTTVGKYQRYRCQACGAWSRGKRAVGSVELRAVA